jgi:hypothetical protein
MYRLGIEYINAFAVIGLCCCDWTTQEHRAEQGTTEIKGERS